MSVTKEQVQTAIAIREYLADVCNFNTRIAGGFCRDVYFGETPKDIDIVVASQSIHDDPAEAHRMLGDILTYLGVHHLGFRMYSEGTSDRIVGGFKCVGNIDVVLYDCKDTFEAIDSFDFNLNQFVLMGLSGTHADSFKVMFAGHKHWRDFEAVREDFTEERRQKMLAKYVNLTSRYPSDSSPTSVPLWGRF